jgi:hypothetical protein
MVVASTQLTTLGSVEPNIRRRGGTLVPSWTQTLFALGAVRCGCATLFLRRACRTRRHPRGRRHQVPTCASCKLKPDLVIANAEENRREDMERRASWEFSADDLSAHGAGRGRINPAPGAALDREPQATALARDNALGERSRSRAEVWSASAAVLSSKKALDDFQCRHLCPDVLRMMAQHVFASAGEPIRAPRSKRPSSIARYRLLPDGRTSSTRTTSKSKGNAAGGAGRRVR